MSAEDTKHPSKHSECLPNSAEFGVRDGVTIRKLRRSSSLPENLGRRPFTLRKSFRASRILSQYRITNPSHLDSLTEVLSGLYAMILVVVGASLPVSHIITPAVTRQELEAFYIYLFVVGIAFMIYLYIFIIHAEKYRSTCTPCGNKSHNQEKSINSRGHRKNKESLIKSEDHESSLLQPFKVSEQEEPSTILSILSNLETPSSVFTFSTTETLSSSYYLRLGALVFGLCTVVENGLEFSLFLETLIRKHSCSGITVTLIIRPFFQFIYTTMQLYFIFLNSKICIHRYRTLAQFGVMHMVATNLCSWLRYVTTHAVVVVNASAEVIQAVNNYKQDYHAVNLSDHQVAHDTAFHQADRTSNDYHNYQGSGENGGHELETLIYDANGTEQCREVTLLTWVTQSISHFLYPSVIEYGLISAAILVVIWVNIDNNPHPGEQIITGSRARHLSSRLHSVTSSGALSVIRNYVRVDCAGAIRGLFAGIFLICFTLMGVIVCVVLIRKQSTISENSSRQEPSDHSDISLTSISADNHQMSEHNDDGLQKAVIIISQLMFFILCSVAGTVSCVAAYRMKGMRFTRKNARGLDEVLLVVSLVGVVMLRSFHAIAGYYNTDVARASECRFTVVTSVVVVIQTFIQTMFILDALHRIPRDSTQQKTKPGLNCVTFLLVCNITIWIVNNLVMLSDETNRIPLHFYGPAVWSIINHVSTPLTIFYQFHATVCLSAIWKTTYKIKD